MTATYLDSTALVKLVVEEDESDALLEYVRSRPRRVSCALARVEVVRSAQKAGRRARDRAIRLMKTIDLIRVDDALLGSALDIDGAVLRSLDAIHLAAALALGSDLGDLVTYDFRMSEAARSLGLAVVAPA